MARYRDVAPEAMTAAQKRAEASIVSGKRGRISGPFKVLIHAPEICELAGKLGEHLRWGTSLPPRLSELAICTTARFWRAQYEWFAHARLAREAGVPEAALEALRKGDHPTFEQRDESLIYRVCTEIFEKKRLSDASFAEAKATLGEPGIIEIIAIIGYYTLIGNTLNVFQVPLPDGETPPFPE